jgi:hypothetical protein
VRDPRATRSRAEGTSPRTLLRIKLQRLLRRKLRVRLQLVAANCSLITNKKEKLPQTRKLFLLTVSAIQSG